MVKRIKMELKWGILIEKKTLITLKMNLKMKYQLKMIRAIVALQTPNQRTD